MPMKLACASGSFHRAIEGGELTQLEFLDLCARELVCDGVVLDMRHFPRNDDDYLAQVKKMATDRGLTIAALTDSRFFVATAQQMSDVLDRALALGAPIVAAALGRETELSWSEQLDRLNTATSLAKSRNVTLALRNAPETFASSTHDCKRVMKETDSAWLRYGPQPQGFDVASDPRLLAPNTILLWSDAGIEDARSIAQTIAGFADFRGHLTLDEASGAATIVQMAASIRVWRMAILNRK
jgi:hypothetical protein